jgi:hypothetical protein
MTCRLPEPNHIPRSVDNTLLDKRKLITVPQILLLLDIHPVDLPRNSSLPVSLGITNSSNNNNSKRRVDTMVSNHSSLGTPMEVIANNLDTASNNQSPTLLISSTNLMSLGRRDSVFKPPTYLHLLLIHESCTSRLRKLSCLQTRL